MQDIPREVARDSSGNPVCLIDAVSKLQVLLRLALWRCSCPRFVAADLRCHLAGLLYVVTQGCFPVDPVSVENQWSPKEQGKSCEALFLFSEFKLRCRQVPAQWGVSVLCLFCGSLCRSCRRCHASVCMSQQRRRLRPSCESCFSSPGDLTLP